MAKATILAFLVLFMLNVQAYTTFTYDFGGAANSWSKSYDFFSQEDSTQLTATATYQGSTTSTFVYQTNDGNSWAGLGVYSPEDTVDSDKVLVNKDTEVLTLNIAKEVFIKSVTFAFVSSAGATFDLLIDGVSAFQGSLNAGTGVRYVTFNLAGLNVRGSEFAFTRLSGVGGFSVQEATFYVPEPATILGSLLVVGIAVAARRKKAQA